MFLKTMKIFFSQITVVLKYKFNIFFMFLKTMKIFFIWVRTLRPDTNVLNPNLSAPIKTASIHSEILYGTGG